MEYYYTSSEKINETEGKLLIDEYEFRHLVKVLRKKTGDKITVTDGLRNIYNCEIKKIDRDKMLCSILSKDFNLFEPDIDLTLCIAPLRNMSRYEFAMEKAVELGVNKIVPVITDFTILKNEFSRNKRDRIEKIIIAAMGQSQRCFKPLFEKCVKLNELIKKFSDEKNKVVMYEFSDDMNPYKYDSSSNKVILLIGPEGGFSKEEIRDLTNSGWQIRSLGSRKVRAETAAIISINQIISKLN